MSAVELKVAVCAICRNERPYVEEWISYYQTIGFDGVYIYDNESDDGTSELLTALDAIGEIKRVHWPRKEGIPPQRDAYGHFLNNFAHRYDYVLVCDLDEFLVIDGGGVKELIGSAEALHQEVGAIALPWLVFGSGGQEVELPGLVIDRFKLCDKSVARSVKTLYSTRNTYNMRTHICDLLNGAYLDNELAIAQWDQKMPIKLKKPTAGKARIHHYYTKSREEWLKRRAQPKADRAKIELKKIQEFDKYSAFVTVNDQASLYSDKVIERIAAIRKKVSEAQANADRARIDLISVNSEWLFGVVHDLPCESAVVRISGDAAEAFARCTKISERTHLFTYKNKWRNTYRQSLAVSIVGSSRSTRFTAAEYPSPIQSLRALSKFMRSAEEHIFSYALLALSETDISETLDICRSLAFSKNKKFASFFISLSAYSCTKEVSAFLSELEGEDEDFKKMIFDPKKSPYLSNLKS